MQENHKLLPAIASNGVLVAVIGLQVTFVPWILVTVVNWSTDDLLNKNIALYLMLLPLLVCPLLISLMLKICKSKRFAAFLENYLIYIALAGLVVIDWLIYARFHSLFPFSLEALHTGWFSNDNVPIILFAAWLNWSLIIVVPTAFGIIIKTNLHGRGLRSSMHVGFAISGLAMGLQWGDAWSLPFNHMVWMAISLPVLFWLQDRKPAGDIQGDPIYYPVFSTIGLSILIGFWASAITAQSKAQPSQNLAWLALCAASCVLLVGTYRKTRVADSRNGRILVACCFIACCTCMVFMILVNLNAWFAWLLVWWQIIGLAGFASVPELLEIKEKAGTKRVGARMFFAALLTIIGIVIPMIVNIYDPISSYAAFIIIAIPIIMAFTIFTPAKERP